MAVFKCKMCGGDLNVAAIATVCRCDYCGTNQTVPSSRDEEVNGLFERAELLRKKCDFDRAEETYEKILELDGDEAEAYWGVILCKYGIEYVEDPKTKKRVPTCHRTSYDAIVTDIYYKEALKHADALQKAVYEQEARAIDAIQKNILSLAHKEEPFDVFICYKETDGNGERTRDSVIANEIYHQLTNEGYKVFYSAITLEDKLGEAYEPYIFSALNSAKVMLVVGTKKEYFEAVWVKNEWSRFLKIMKSDRSKLLIPCYRDMDPYDLPNEFAHMQAQDMSKIGFINDVVRGIKKVIIKNQQSNDANRYYTDVSSNKDTHKKDKELDKCLKRARLLLEDGSFGEAEIYATKAISLDSQCAEAYLIRFLSQERIKNKSDLVNKKVSFKHDLDFEKAVKYGESGFSSELMELSNERDYNQARDVCLDAKTVEDYRRAKALLIPLGNYRNCDSLVKMCEEKIGRIKHLKIKERTDEILYSSTLAPMAEAACKMVEREKKLKAAEGQIKQNRLSSCIVVLVISAILFVSFATAMIEVVTLNALLMVGTIVATPILFFSYLIRHNKKHLTLFITLTIVTVGFFMLAVPFIMAFELRSIYKIKKEIEKENRAYMDARRTFREATKDEDPSVVEMIKALALQGISPLKIADMIAEEKIEYN